MFSENPGVFFKHFGETLNFTIGGVAKAVKGIWHAPTMDNGSGRAEAINVETHVQVSAADVAGVRINRDSLVRGGVTYYVVDIAGDGVISILYLSEDKA